GVPALLRRRTLREAAAAGAPPLAIPESGAVLASGDDVPVWVQDRSAPAPTWIAAHALPDVLAGEPLKRHFEAGRFLALLPLIDFLRQALASGWDDPPLRATFIVDDPNLRRETYGYLNYRALADEAERVGYHAGIAMVPLDATVASPAVARIFRENERLSVLVHGNDHVRAELGQALPPDERLAVAV